MFSTIGLLSLLILPGREWVPHPASFYRPRVEVWTNRGEDPYTGGQRARVYFRADEDAYVTVLRVDTDGRVRVLFPREPWEDNFARGGREYEVLAGFSRDAFYIDDDPGVGYIFAVAAADPFAYDALEAGDHWDYRVIADGRIRGDPYVALTDLAQRIVPARDTDWDYDIVPYYVERHYEYPRFLCYDCHTYVSYPYWSPYDYTCVRFRIVVFDDPYYYPYRYYGGTRVVFTRPLRPEPRFIFKDRQGSSLFITRVRERPANDDRRREVGVRGRDLGGGGTVAPPIARPPRERQRDEAPPADDDRRGWRRRPDRPDRPEVLDRPERREPRERPSRPDKRAPDSPPERIKPPAVAEPERGRVEPRRPPESRPRVEPAAPPRVQPANPPPRTEPRAEPKRDAGRDQPSREPELKRRKPS